MQTILERILNIIANDAFPDEDKPYIIREVIHTYNAFGTSVPDANETWYDEKYVEAAKEESYKKGYHKGISTTMQKFNEKPLSLKTFPTETQVRIIYENGFEEGKQSASDLQQEELELQWNAGYLKGYNKAYAEVIKESEQQEDAKWDAGYLKGVSDAEAKLAPKHAVELKAEWDKGFAEGRKGRKEQVANSYKEGYDKGYGKGYDEATAEAEVVNSNWYRRGYNDGVIKGDKAEYDKGYLKGRESLKGDGLYLEGYQTGRKAGKDEIINYINTLNNTTGGILR